MSAQSILHEHRKRQPMTDAEALEALLQYIDNQQSPEAFADFLDNLPPDFSD